MDTLEPQAAYALWANDYPPHAHNALMLAEERAMLALLPAKLRRMRVFDAGCGSGRYLRHAAARGATALLGVDLTNEMLRQAHERALGSRFALLQGSLTALPVRSNWADLTICGLTIGHLDDLGAPLAELRRVTRRGGTILISDFHPVGAALGWRREFRVGDQRYAVRHTTHTHSAWQRACTGLGLQICAMLEPQLDPMSIPADAVVDPVALQVPVALVYRLRVT